MTDGECRRQFSRAAASSSVGVATGCGRLHRVRGLVSNRMDPLTRSQGRNPPRVAAFSGAAATATPNPLRVHVNVSLKHARADGPETNWCLNERGQ